jgi:hypothetical protein
MRVRPKNMSASEFRLYRREEILVKVYAILVAGKAETGFDPVPLAEHAEKVTDMFLGSPEDYHKAKSDSYNYK